MVRAVLEGVSFGLRDSLELIKGLGVPIEQVRGFGRRRGRARSGARFRPTSSGRSWC